LSPDTTKRLITAGVAVPILIVFFLLGGIPFFVLIVFVAFAGIMEMSYLMRTKGAILSNPIMYCLAFVVQLSAFVNSKYLEKQVGLLIYIAVLTFSCAVILLLVLLRGEIKDSIKRASFSLYVHLYINFPLSCAIFLRNFELNSLKNLQLMIHSGDDVGTIFLFFVIAVTFLNDTGAYFTGRAFGKTPLAPSISPKKSVEGALGGVICACLTGVLIKVLDSIFFRIIPDFPYLHVILLGLLIGISGVIGDLFESMMKRDAEIKDAGVLLPGHGGILDRLDSLSFTIPLTYFYVKIFYAFF